LNGSAFPATLHEATHFRLLASAVATTKASGVNDYYYEFLMSWQTHPLSKQFGFGS
jgi:hypothetical protein